MTVQLVVPVEQVERLAAADGRRQATRVGQPLLGTGVGVRPDDLQSGWRSGVV